MKSTLLGLAVTAAAASSVTSTAHAGTVTSDGADLVIKTKGGFEARTADEKFSFKIGGRVQAQYDQYNDSMNLIDGEGDTGSRLFIRRARVYIKGDVYENWAYKIQFNVADSGSGGGTFEDLYVRWKGFQWTNVTVGKFKEPFSLQELTSSKWVTAIERSANTSFFAEGRSLGIGLSGANDFGGYAVGAFDNGGQDDEGAQLWAFTGRGFLSPINTERALLHIGAALTTRDEGDSTGGGDATQGIKSGDEALVSFVSPTERRDGYNLEIAGKLGPVHAQAEYNERHRTATGDGEDATTSGWYAQIGGFVTGESRPYKRGKWDKIKPLRKNGIGAWELFARIEGLDFDDDGVTADTRNKGNSYVIGANWYPNEIIRVSANYVHTTWDQKLAASDDPKVDSVVRADSVSDPAVSDDTGNGFSIRVQAAF